MFVYNLHVQNFELSECNSNEEHRYIYIGKYIKKCGENNLDIHFISKPVHVLLTSKSVHVLLTRDEAVYLIMSVNNI